jgi:hypothetical protein
MDTADHRNDSIAIGVLVARDFLKLRQGRSAVAVIEMF